jgi:hypothetical protein
VKWWEEGLVERERERELGKERGLLITKEGRSVEVGQLPVALALTLSGGREGESLGVASGVAGGVTSDIKAR